MHNLLHLGVGIAHQSPVHMQLGQGGPSYELQTPSVFLSPSLFCDMFFFLAENPQLDPTKCAAFTMVQAAFFSLQLCEVAEVKKCGIATDYGISMMH